MRFSHALSSFREVCSYSEDVTKVLSENQKKLFKITDFPPRIIEQKEPMTQALPTTEQILMNISAAKHLGFHVRLLLVLT